MVFKKILCITFILEQEEPGLYSWPGISNKPNTGINIYEDHEDVIANMVKVLYFGSMDANPRPIFCLMADKENATKVVNLLYKRAGLQDVPKIFSLEKLLYYMDLAAYTYKVENLVEFSEITLSEEVC